MYPSTQIMLLVTWCGNVRHKDPIVPFFKHHHHVQWKLQNQCNIYNKVNTYMTHIQLSVIITYLFIIRSKCDINRNTTLMATSWHHFPLPLGLYPNGEGHVTTFKIAFNLNTIFLVKENLSLFSTAHICTFCTSLSCFLYISFASWLAMLQMSCSFKNKSRDNSTMFSIISFTWTLCLFIIW